MKKLLLIAPLLLMFGTAHAEWGWPQDEEEVDPGQSQEQEQDQSQFQIQGQDQSIYNKQYLDSESNSRSSSYSGSHSSSGAAAGAAAGSISGSGDQATSVKIRYEAVSARAATLDLPYCGEGVAAQAAEGGFGVTNTNFICESQMALKMTLMLVEMELASFDAGKGDAHAEKATVYMEQSESIMEEVQMYIHTRGGTAAVGAVARDFMSPILTIGLLILLL